jgi:hypothetical protein
MMNWQMLRYMIWMVEKLITNRKVLPQESIDVSSLAKGLYLVYINYNDKKISQKLVISVVNYFIPTYIIPCSMVMFVDLDVSNTSSGFG